MIRLIDNQGTHPAMTVGPDGNPIIVYHHSSAGQVKLAVCNDPDCASATVSSLTTTSASRDHDVTIGSNGLPIIAWVRSSNYSLQLLLCADAACSTGAVRTIASGVSTSNDGLSLAIGPDGLPLVSYRNNANNLVVAACSAPDCSSSSMNQISTGGQRSSMVIAPSPGGQGTPLISFIDDSGFVAVAACSQSDCSSSSVHSHSTLGNNVESTSITINRLGQPLVFFTRGTPGGGSYLLTCTTNCTGQANSTTLSSARFDAMTLGTRALPVLIDSFSGGLNLIQCDNTACTDRHTLNEFGGNAAQFSAITVRSDGRPIVAYRNTDSQALEILDCANALCAPYFRAR